MKKISVFRFSALGDVAMTYPVLKVLTETHPGVQVQLVSRPFFEPVFRHLKNVKFFPARVDKTYKGITGLYKLFKELKQENPDFIADLHDVLRTKVLRLFFRMNGTPVYVIDKGRTEKKRLVQRPLAESQPLKTTHERYADVFRSAGLDVDLSRFRPEKPELDNQIQLFLSPFEGTKIIGIAPLARHTGKQYPLGGTKEAIKLMLKNNRDIIVMLFGAPAERKVLDAVNPDPGRVFNLSGMFSFEGELQIISRLNVMLSMDSGNGHLAANFGVPVVTVWGVTHPYAGFAPLGQTSEQQILPDTEKFPMLPCSVYGNKICQGYETIWDDILPEQIAETVLKQL